MKVNTAYMQENFIRSSKEEKVKLSKNFYKILTDEELLSLLSSDKLAEEEFYNRYKERVKNLVSKYKLNSLEKQDLIQEGMIGLFQAIENYDKNLGIKFSTYSRRCIENRIKNALSTLWKHKKKEVSTEEKLDELVEIRNPESKMLESDFLSNVQAFLETFSEIERDVIRLFLEDKSYKAIGEELGVSIKKVDNILRKVRKKLSSFISQVKSYEDNL